MQLLNRLSIRSKLYAGFAIVSAALLVAVAVGWMSMLSVSGTVRNGYEQAVIAEATSKWAYNMRVSQSQSAAIGHHIKNADGSDMHASDKAAYDKEFAQLEGTGDIGSGSRRHRADHGCTRQVGGARPEGDRPLDGRRQARGGRSGERRGEHGRRQPLHRSRQLRHAAEAAAERAKASGERQAEVLMGIFIAIAVALALGHRVLLARRIAGRLKPVQAGMNSLANHCLAGVDEALTAMAVEGDLTLEVVPVTEPVEVKGKDELAELAGTFNALLDRTQSSIQAYSTMREKRVAFADVIDQVATGDITAEVHTSSEKDRISFAFISMLESLRDVAKAADLISEGDVSFSVQPKSEKDALGNAFVRMQAYLREMVAAAERIADRDLSQTVETRSERDALGIAFNRMTENVSAVLSEVSTATTRLLDASEQMATSSQ